jgi:ABC-type uncharacterized transport system permease subunit
MQCGVRTNAVNNVNITHISETGNNMNDYQLGDVANDHVLTQGGWLPIGHARNQAVEADRKARSIATYERASGIAWILIGVLQIAMVITILAGVWNIIAGVSRLRLAPAIERRHYSVPTAFDGIGMLVTIGLINLFFGAFFGVVMVAVDFVIRQIVLDNRDIFTTRGAGDPAPHDLQHDLAHAIPSNDPTLTRPGW